uniref:Reverse transcriptase Ty1/copia-type domain-containing protein n=1 Tax=Glossina pallidipes TaxID=7398 RepID=A0A1A9ZNY7_GLOPL
MKDQPRKDFVADFRETARLDGSERSIEFSSKMLEKHYVKYSQIEKKEIVVMLMLCQDCQAISMKASITKKLCDLTFDSNLICKRANKDSTLQSERNETIDNELLAMGLARGEVDQYVYCETDDGQRLYVAIYVDDLLLFPSSQEGLK